MDQIGLLKYFQAFIFLAFPRVAEFQGPSERFSGRDQHIMLTNLPLCSYS